MYTKSKARIALARAASLRLHVITRINCPFAFEKKGFFNSVPSLTLSFFFFVLQVRRRFLPSMDRDANNDPNATKRPPAPLPIFAAEYVPDDNYEDPDSLDRSREGSVISLEWPSPYNEIRVQPTNKKHSTLTAKNPLYVETFKDNWSAYDNLPPPLPQPRKGADVYMSPLTLPQRPISGLSTPGIRNTPEHDEHGYLKCVASNGFDRE